MMSEGISENDLPSVKFENDLKTLMNYTTLEDYVKKQTTVQDIDNWIQSFQSKVEQYLKDSSRDTSLDYDKRCKHFNYLIKVIISKIISLSHGIAKTGEWSRKIKDWIGKLYTSNPNLMCKEINTYTTKDKKILGTFCEDSDFIKKKLNDIQNSNQCNSIRNDISSRKNELTIILQRETRKGGNYTKIDKECSINKLDTIFPFITCNSSVENASDEDAHTASNSHVDIGEYSDRLRTESSSSMKGLPDRKQGSLAIPGGSETNNDSSSNALVLVSIPIFSVFALSFFLYKYTPLRSKFHSYYRNRGDILLNKDYEETEQMLSNTQELNDMYSESMQYNLSYQTL
ncbi:PIR Superfamily Protein [Plasmodium ovale curtisi]|uniref:PIR Superfamily Protein n=1 Tax=Plasmodium ovale curtisi TaxID=864141 RepID=A0A1A8WAP4_PLAOA|nr:PIR Superfamily Protein [Plasmodium ovale curtisi]